MEELTRELTQEELRIQRICELEAKIGSCKYYLKQSDYQAIKFAEGLLTEQEYASIKAQRQSWRDEINRLEALLRGE